MNARKRPLRKIDFVSPQSNPVCRHFGSWEEGEFFAVINRAREIEFFRSTTQFARERLTGECGARMDGEHLKMRAAEGRAL